MVRVGQILYEERTKRGLTLEFVAKATKIRVSFLLAIEKGEYAKLPSSAYIKGFVKNYIDFLGLPKKELIPLFKREFDDSESLRVLPIGLSENQEIPFKRLRLTYSSFFIVCAFILLAGYILFQYRYAIVNPPLDVSSPRNDQVFSKSVAITGKTDPNAAVFVNEEPVSLDKDGNFTKKIDVFPGKTIIRIKAINRLGKSTEIEKHIEVIE
ncbi:MAG: helix-turn-helix domain-containing protein [bacterium]|nr:helix-turn-helix domain-containing protein [bacterium]